MKLGAQGTYCRASMFVYSLYKSMCDIKPYRRITEWRDLLKETEHSAETCKCATTGVKYTYM